MALNEPANLLKYKQHNSVNVSLQRFEQIALIRRLPDVRRPRQHLTRDILRLVIGACNDERYIACPKGLRNQSH